MEDSYNRSFEKVLSRMFGVFVSTKFGFYKTLGVKRKARPLISRDAGRNFAQQFLEINAGIKHSVQASWAAYRHRINQE